MRKKPTVGLSVYFCEEAGTTSPSPGLLTNITECLGLRARMVRRGPSRKVLSKATSRLQVKCRVGKHVVCSSRKETASHQTKHG